MCSVFSILGPWSPWRVIYDIPKPYNNTKLFFCYAPKSHPELALLGNELIVSYANNALQVKDLNDDLFIYVPQMLRVYFSDRFD
jgi:hypothetical protein